MLCLFPIQCHQCLREVLFWIAFGLEAMFVVLSMLSPVDSVPTQKVSQCQVS